MNLKQARDRLTKLWFTAGLAFLLLLIVQSLRGVYGDATQDVWSWALPTLMPTLLLIIGVLVGDHMNKKVETAPVSESLFRLTYWLSAFYVAVVALTVLIAPISAMSPLELMKMSNFWLGPLQGLVTGAFGVFFIVQKSQLPGDGAAVRSAAGRMVVDARRHSRGEPPAVTQPKHGED